MVPGDGGSHGSAGTRICVAAACGRQITFSTWPRDRPLYRPQAETEKKMWSLLSAFPPRDVLSQIYAFLL